MEAVCEHPFPLQKRFTTPDQVYILYLLMHLVPFTKLTVGYVEFGGSAVTEFTECGMTKVGRQERKKKKEGRKRGRKK